MNHYLYIDTGHSTSLIMLFDDVQVLAIRTNTQQSNHGQVINQQIHELMQAANLAFQNLNAICVLNGPGSYTGLRISLAAAKGYCYAHNIPLILINKLDLIHFCYSPISQATQTNVVLKAREDEYFTAIFSANEDSISTIQLLSQQEILSRSNEQQEGLILTDDENLKADFSKIQVVSIQKEQIRSLCLKYFSSAKYADLLSSEPFYLKNVFINKTNKL